MYTGKESEPFSAALVLYLFIWNILLYMEHATHPHCLESSQHKKSHCFDNIQLNGWLEYENCYILFQAALLFRSFSHIIVEIN